MPSAAEDLRCALVDFDCQKKTRLQRLHFRLRSDRIGQILHHDGESGKGRRQKEVVVLDGAHHKMPQNGLPRLHPSFG